MTDTITVGLQPSAGEIDQRMLRMPEAFQARVVKEMERMTLDLETQIRDVNLHGAVLHWRTGRLARSVHRQMEVTRTGVIGSVSVGLEAPYGRLHEYGETVDVPPHPRTIAKLHGRVTKIRTFMAAQRTRIGKLGGELTSVMTKAYQIHYPERSFARSALALFRLSFFDRMAHACRGLGGAALNAD
jgi:hypothetical protein